MNPNAIKSFEATWPRRMEPQSQPASPDAGVDPTALIARAFGRTDKGRERSGNEDQFLVASPARSLWIQQSSLHPSDVHRQEVDGELFVVADGMGGHAGGARASALAVGAVETSLLSALKWLFTLKGADAEPNEVLEQLKGALRSADASVCEAAARSPELRDMGTTLTLAYRHGASLFIAHVGDSRAYLWRNDTLHRLTTDHTLVGEMVRRGVLDPAEAASHELRHIITNAVGGPVPGVRSEVHRFRLAPNDMLLLCTDGLTEMVPDDDIAAVLRAERNPRAACDQLIDLANSLGGRDNITVVLARFEQAAAPTPTGN